MENIGRFFAVCLLKLYLLVVHVEVKCLEVTVRVILMNFGRDVIL